MNHSAELLRGERVTKYFGGLAAVNGVDIVVRAGEIVGLIGPNGSGKTTLFNCLSRLLPIDSGRIFFKGRDITNARPYQVARMGLSRTFQVIRVYRKMTVRENMLISRQWRGETLWGMLKPSHPHTERRARELLDFLKLSHLMHEYAGNEIKARIRELNREQGKAFLLIEHNINFIADLCERVYVLNYGELLAHGTPHDIMENEAVIEAYFGT